MFPNQLNESKGQQTPKRKERKGRRTQLRKKNHVRRTPKATGKTHVTAIQERGSKSLEKDDTSRKKRTEEAKAVGCHHLQTGERSIR